MTEYNGEEKEVISYEELRNKYDDDVQIQMLMYAVTALIIEIREFKELNSFGESDDTKTVNKMIEDAWEYFCEVHDKDVKFLKLKDFEFYLKRMAKEWGIA